MTLKEKFEDILRVTNKLWNKVDAESCEKIADEFAIGFAAWCIWNNDEDLANYSYKELLEHYKKEEGL